MNDNSDIYSSCKCGAKFDSFIRPNTEYTDEALATEKNHSTKRKSKAKRSRFSFDSIKQNMKEKDRRARKYIGPKKGRRARKRTSPTPRIELESIRTPETRLLDTNISFAPYGIPSANPTNFHLAQRFECEASIYLEV